MKSEIQNSCDEAEEEEEDLNSSVWMPVIIDNKVDKK